VKRGELVRITDIEGLQVSDFVAFNAKKPREKFSQSHTRSDNGFKCLVGKGDKLFSNLGNAMFTILEDTFGIHDTYFASCNRAIYKRIFRYAPRGPGHPYDGCLEHLAQALRGWNVRLDEIPDPFNINMNARPDFRTGKFLIELPRSKPNDHIVLKAEMDCLVALTSCADEISPCNGGRSTPIKVEVLSRN